MRLSQKKAATSGALLLASIGLVGGLGGASATAAGTAPSAAPPNATAGAAAGLPLQGTPTHARLRSLNNSGVLGKARVRVNGRHLRISVNAHGLLRNMPHAMHIHFDAMSRHRCPTVGDDNNGDHRVSTSEGHPAYGSIRVSLTKRGPTGPGSGLAVNRFPTAPRGEIHYHRSTTTSRKVARAIRRGNAAVVIHGIDYNHNGKYDFAGAGKSDLAPSVPAEATDPVSCGVLHAPKSPLPAPPGANSAG